VAKTQDLKLGYEYLRDLVKQEEHQVAGDSGTSRRAMRGAKSLLRIMQAKVSKKKKPA
jgi:hypothetical protein